MTFQQSEQFPKHLFKTKIRKMNTNFYTNLIIRHITDTWAKRLPNLAQFLFEQFGYPPTWTHEVKQLFIAEMADGDVAAGNIGGLYAAKWIFEEGVFKEVALDYHYREMYNTDPSDNLYLSPSFLFCYGQGQILISERYGPALKRRLRGKIIGDQDSIKVEWVALCSTTK